MSHAGLAPAIALRAPCMVPGALRATLKTLRRALDALAPLHPRALLGAVALAAIADATDFDQSPAPPTGEDPKALSFHHAPSPGKAWTNGAFRQKLNAPFWRSGAQCSTTYGPAAFFAARHRASHGVGIDGKR